jgi:UDP-N-acetylmuramoyl-L-alanine---L-glutamate ligase
MNNSNIHQYAQSIINSLEKEKILILGLAKEGISTFNFLRQILPNKTIGLADEKNSLPSKLQQAKGITTHLGPDHLDHLKEYSLIFKTPGIPQNLPQIQQAVKNGVKLSSNLQLFLELVEERKAQNSDQLLGLPSPLTIGVTGTKGKSTTASMIHHVLSNNGYKTALIGNIGKPALDEAHQIVSIGIFVIEMSSHQLSHLTLSPDIAIVHNITSEHLDYYKDTTEYIRSKEAITKYQKVNQYVLFNPLFQNAVKIAELSPGRKIKISPTSSLKSVKNDIQVYLKSHKLTFRDIKVSEETEEAIIDQNEIPLLGQHNLHNVAPSIVIAKMLGLKTGQITQAIKSFEPLPHRLEKVAVINGVTYVNDSMATMPDAAISSLSCFDDRSIILLAGGHERNQDFVPLATKIATSKVKALAFFAPNGPRLKNEVEKQLQKLDIKKEFKTKEADSMDEALEFAYQIAKPNDVVLLAPGAASFGIFENYADRGEKFKQWVQLKKSQLKTA